MLKAEAEWIAGQELLLERITFLTGQITASQREYKSATREIKQLSLARKDIADRFSERYLSGAMVNTTLQVMHSETRLVPGNNANQAFVEAAASVPGLRLDHVRLVQKDRRPVGLITMPYHHGEKFTASGENDHVVWQSYDSLSWWNPGATCLTVVFPRTEIDPHYNKITFPKAF